MREDWLVGDLLAQLQTLLEKMEAGQGLTAEEQLDLTAWQAAVGEAGLQAELPGQALPWLQHLEQVLCTLDRGCRGRRMLPGLRSEPRGP